VRHQGRRRERPSLRSDGARVRRNGCPGGAGTGGQVERNTQPGKPATSRRAAEPRRERRAGTTDGRSRTGASSAACPSVAPGRPALHERRDHARPAPRHPGVYAVNGLPIAVDAVTRPSGGGPFFVSRGGSILASVEATGTCRQRSTMPDASPERRFRAVFDRWSRRVRRRLALGSLRGQLQRQTSQVLEAVQLGGSDQRERRGAAPLGLGPCPASFHPGCRFRSIQSVSMLSQSREESAGVGETAPRSFVTVHDSGRRTG
jgi:hypothetical protein